jgi:hypothetical protein
VADKLFVSVGVEYCLVKPALRAGKEPARGSEDLARGLALAGLIMATESDYLFRRLFLRLRELASGVGGTVSSTRGY